MPREPLPLQFEFPAIGKFSLLRWEPRNPDPTGRGKPTLHLTGIRSHESCHELISRLIISQLLRHALTRLMKNLLLPRSVRFHVAASGRGRVVDLDHNIIAGIPPLGHHIEINVELFRRFLAVAYMKVR